VLANTVPLVLAHPLVGAPIVLPAVPETGASPVVLQPPSFPLVVALSAPPVVRVSTVLVVVEVPPRVSAIPAALVPTVHGALAVVSRGLSLPLAHAQNVLDALLVKSVMGVLVPMLVHVVPALPVLPANTTKTVVPLHLTTVVVNAPLAPLVLLASGVRAVVAPAQADAWHAECVGTKTTCSAVVLVLHLTRLVPVQRVPRVVTADIVSAVLA